jgi:hypothetical protein
MYGDKGKWMMKIKVEAGMAVGGRGSAGGTVGRLFVVS